MTTEITCRLEIGVEVVLEMLSLKESPDECGDSTITFLNENSTTYIRKTRTDKHSNTHTGELEPKN